MRIKFLAISTVFLALVSVCVGKDKIKRPVQPVYANSYPSRVKPVFDKPSFDRGNRVRPIKEKAVIERPLVTKREIEKPKFDKDKHDKPEWAKTVLETKWRTDSEQVYFPTPKEKAASSKVKRGWFRDLRAP